MKTQDFAYHAKKDTIPALAVVAAWSQHSATLTTVRMETVLHASTASAFTTDSVGIPTALTRQMMDAYSVSKISLLTQ